MFYIAHGDMFRAQGDLLTPSELRDTLHQRRQVMYGLNSEIPLFGTLGIRVRIQNMFPLTVQIFGNQLFGITLKLARSTV